MASLDEFSNEATNYAAGGITDVASNGVKRVHTPTGVSHPAKKVVNGAVVNVPTAGNAGSIPGKTDLEFLRRLVDIVIKDGLIGAMDRDT